MISASASRAGRGGPAASNLAIIGVTVVGVFAALIWLAGLQGVEETPESIGSSLSAGPGGTLALYRWLGRAGFEVSRIVGGEEFPPGRADTLVVVDANDNFPEGQARSVRRWVEEGKTLVLVTGGGALDFGSSNPLLREFGAGLEYTSGYTPTVRVSQPLFTVPPVEQARMPGSQVLELPVTGTLVLASARTGASESKPLTALIRAGAGRVFLFSTDYPFTNEGLRESDNGGLVYNIMQMAGGRRVAFDEAHHGESKGGDLIAILTGNAWGWALIYGALLLAGYAVWSARRLGPPLPVATPDARRPTSDYVKSVAGLFRRARKPDYAAQRYLLYFKRTLARHAAIDATLPDAEFVQTLAARGRHIFDPEEMLRVVERLRVLAGSGGGAGIEAATLAAVQQAERVRLQALGLS